MANSPESQFSIRQEDLDALDQSDGFTILRQHLAEHYAFYSFCDTHSASSPEFQAQNLIVRDVLHALLVPVVELFDRAVTIAAAATHATKLEDLEYAFTGSSRSAFLWLQCFLSSEKERDWCYTRGCPACTVDHTLDSEFSIRLLYAACLLSDVHYPFTIEGPTLPSFMFFLESLEQAVSSDPLYGPQFFEIMQPKALATRDGVEELIHQTLELDVILSQPSSPDLDGAEMSGGSAHSSPVMGPCGGTSAKGIKLKRSKLAKKQTKLKLEEEQWMERMWAQQACEAMQYAAEVVSSATNLDAVALEKQRAVFRVAELAPE